MDKRLTRGVVLALIGGGLVWFGKGMLEYTGDNRMMGNAMLISLILGLYIFVLAACSLYDFAVNPGEHE